jgi:hypothetical protein
MISENREVFTTKWTYTWLWVGGKWDKLEVDGRTYRGTGGYFQYVDEVGARLWELVSGSPENEPGSIADAYGAGSWHENWLLNEE